jgi:hypothetical protein
MVAKELGVDYASQAAGNKAIRTFLGVGGQGLWGWNAILRDTTYHLDNAQLLNQLEANLEPALSHAVIEDQINKWDLDQWLTLVKNLDDKKRCKCQRQCADTEEAARAQLKRTSTTTGLSEPSRHFNCAAVPGASTMNANVVNRLPKLMDTEQQILIKNNRCLKCWKVLAGHRSNNCPNGFPTALNYKTLTNDNVTATKK